MEKKDELLLSYCKYLWDCLKINQEATDRYFNYYLLFVTSPVLITAALLAKPLSFSIRNAPFALIACILSLVGFAFFLSAIKSRIVRLRIVNKLNEVESHFLEPGLFGQSLDERIKWPKRLPFSFFRRTGHDFSISLTQMIINSFWFAVSAYMYFDWSFVWYLAVFLVSFIAHVTCRRLELSGYTTAWRNGKGAS